jgi:hypothetical protein
MRFRRRYSFGITLAALLCVFGGALANGQVVRVLIYNSAKVPDGVVAQAGREAVRIFRAAGVPVTWVNCTGRGPSGECLVQPQGPELVLHVIPRGKVSTDSVYGEAFLGGDGEGKYADVFYDRILEAQRELGASPSLLLGAVSAHEIGHLLLGLRAHSWAGIMAPVWRKESFRDLQMGQLFFTRDQALQLRERNEEDGNRMANHLSRKGTRVEGLNGNP